MQDNEFLFNFDNCSLSKDQLDHAGFLRIIWLCLNKHVFDHAVIRIKQGLVSHANLFDAEDKCHETLTRLWTHLVYNKMCQPSANFEEFITQNPHLLDKNLPLKYYSKSRLKNERAVLEWIEPDLKSLFE